MCIRIIFLLVATMAMPLTVKGAQSTDESSFMPVHDLDQVLARVEQLHASNNVDGVRQLFLRVLATPCQTNNKEIAACFTAKRPIVEACLNIAELYKDKSVLMAVAQYEGHIKSLRDTNAPQPVLQNVVGETLEERARWDAEFKLATEAQAFQRALMHADVGIVLAYFCSLLPDTDPDKEAFLDQIAETAKLDPDEQAKMRSRSMRLGQ